MDQDRNTTGLYGDNRLAPYEMARADRGQLLSKMSFRESYASNTQKEDLCLDFVDNFRFQFMALYPSRPPLLLAPLNECGTQKFISSFIRRSGGSIADIYDYDACARFVSNYVRYEMLDDAEALPAKVTSPSTTLAWQVGNCVEMSILLCSLLLGAGYQAYCVCGYAAKEVCDNDQSRTPWPEKLEVEHNPDDDTAKATERVTEYHKYLKKRPTLTSKFDEEEERKGRAFDDPFVAQAEAENTEPVEEEGPRLVHCWVLILPKRRKVDRPLFIEPSTGITAEVTDKRFTGVEAVFNDHNYWVNMQPHLPVSSLSWDLRDLSRWEHVFLTDPEMVAEDDAGEVDRFRAEENTSDAGDAGDQVLDVPASWVVPLTLSRAQFENTFPSRRKKIRYADATVEYFAAYSDPEQRVMEVRIQDDQSMFDQVHAFYKHREDKLRRKSVYPSTDRSGTDRKRHFWFLPGRKRESKVEGLRELIEEPGVQRTMRFYWEAREDGLAKRVEKFWSEKDPHPKKIQEYYRGRDEDRLTYRSASFEAPKEQASTMGIVNVASAPHEDTKRLPFKMTEKFDRNPAVAEEEDVAKRTYIKPTSQEGEIWVLYQYCENSITRQHRLFPKSAEKERESGGGKEVNPKAVTMPYTEPPKESQLLEELRALRLKENECWSEIATKIDECRELLEVRKKEQADIKPVLSVYDTLRNRPRETEQELEQMRAEELRKAESRKDYLAPYLANLDAAKSCKGDYTNMPRLGPEDAKKVRDEALRDLKERLIQRGHIMQNRMDREKEELNRRQAAYQKNIDTTESTKDSEEFAHFCKEATWRMKILDERLSRHIDQASEKYAELAKKLAEDKRLAAIYSQ